MKKSFVKSVCFPLLAALIWGTGFVAQKINTVGTLTFNASRSLVGFVFLLPVILFATKGDFRHLLREETREGTKKLWLGGFLCGTALSIGTFIQQYGMDHGVEAGKAGFITSFYMIFVAVAGLFLGKKPGWKLWLSVFIAAAGLYFLCVKEDAFRISPMEAFILLAALGFAFQILFIDRYTAFCDCVKLSCIQFLVSFVLSGIGAALFETVRPEEIREALLPILYLGIFSSAIAFTLQMVAQKGSNPVLVTVLLSMESVFSVLASALFLRERLSRREYLGCGIVLLAVLLSQLPEELFQKHFRKMRRKRTERDIK